VLQALSGFVLVEIRGGFGPTCYIAKFCPFKSIQQGAS
jgi:hypothetical protein